MFEKIGEKIIPEKRQPEEKRRPEHLKKGINPITACVGTREQFRQEPGKEKEIEDTVSETYCISSVNSLNKFSKGFVNCTGLVAVGLDKKTGENISFVSHEDPGFFLFNEKNKNKFINDLRQRFEELQKRSAGRTIDAIIVGGNYLNYPEHSKKEYIESIRLLSEEVTKSLGFEPLVIVGPKTTGGGDDVFYDNEHRRLYIMRREVGKSTTESFHPSELDSQMKKWDKEL